MYTVSERARMIKYRIKKVSYKDGRINFFPQYEFDDGTWYDMDKLPYSNIESAERVIEYQIRIKEIEDSKKIEYIDY